jgi:release factor glutamine methyltransferase
MMVAASGLSSTGLISAETDIVPGEIAERFADMLRKRQARQPLQHILGTTEFFGLEFLCDARALIPRPDSEIVVEAALRLIPEGEAMTVADLGTGSGCLLAAILANRPQVRGVGVEASPQAASLARENLSRLDLRTRAVVFEGSWVDWPDWQTAGLIISNPPYIASARSVPVSRRKCARMIRWPRWMAAKTGWMPIGRLSRLPGRIAETRRLAGFRDWPRPEEAVSGLLEMAEFTEIGASKDLGGNDRAVWGRKPEK